MDKSCDGTGKAQTSSLLPNCTQNATWRPSVYYQSRARRNPGHPHGVPPPQDTQSLPGELQHKAPWLLPHLKIINPLQTVARFSLQALPILVNISKANSRSLPPACSSPVGRSKIWDEPATACFQPFFHTTSQAGYIGYIWYIYFLPLYLGLQRLFLFYQSVGFLFTGCSHKR